MRILLKKSIVLLVILSLLLSLSSVGIMGADINELKDQKSEIDSKLKDKKDELSANQSEQDSLQVQMDGIESNLNTLQAELDKISNDLAVAEENLNNQKVEYNGIKKKLEDSQAQLGTRINAIYRNGDISYLDVILNAKDVRDFISGFIFVQKIVEQDRTVIASIKENKLLTEQKLKELEKTRNDILALQEEKKAQEDKYMAELDKKMELMDSLESSAVALEQEIDDMAGQSADIMSEINAYYASIASANGGVSPDISNPYTGSGVFTWPLSISGRLSSGFGYRNHPISHTYKMHTGIDIAAPGGTPILAAESGTVVRVQNIGSGYGRNVIIDHGGKICTLYAHMSSVAVGNGQYVTRGEYIGGVGSTGASTGNHLHFEVRVNGSPVNPLGYVSP